MDFKTEQLRNKLYEAIDDEISLEDLVKLSQELDEQILLYYKKKENQDKESSS